MHKSAHPDLILEALSGQLPSVVRAEIAAMPDMSDPRFLPEFGRMLLYLWRICADAAAMEEDPILRRSYMAAALEWSGKITALKAVETRISNDKTPRTIEVSVVGMEGECKPQEPR